MLRFKLVYYGQLTSVMMLLAGLGFIDMLAHLFPRVVGMLLLYHYNIAL